MPVSLPRVIFTLLAATALFLTLRTFWSYTTDPHNQALSSSSSASTATMALVHTVLFQFKDSAQPEAIRAACKHFLSLKDTCIHPTANKPYILSLAGGKDNSPEGAQHGLTHGFVVTFASVEDRDYYVSTDPVHKAFVGSVGDIVEKVTVLDFLDGVY